MLEFPTVRNLGLGGQMLGQRTQFFVIEKQHAASAGCNRLVAIETQRSDPAEKAGMDSFVSASDAFCRILDQVDMIFVTDGGNLFNPDWMPKRVHRHAGTDPSAGTLVEALAMAHLGVLGQPFFQGVGGKPQGAFVYIDENGMRTKIADCVAGGDKSKCLRENFIVALHSCQQKSHMQGIGSTYAHHRSPGTRIPGHILLEPVNKCADTADKGAVNALVQILFLVTHETWYGKRDEILPPVQGPDKVYDMLIHHRILTFSGPDSSPSPRVRNWGGTP